MCHMSSIRFSQLELKVGPTLTHGMMPLGGKVKVVGLVDKEILSTNYKVTCVKRGTKKETSLLHFGSNV